MSLTMGIFQLTVLQLGSFQFQTHGFCSAVTFSLKD